MNDQGQGVNQRENARRSHLFVANRFELRDDLEILGPSGSALGDDQRVGVDAPVDRPEKRHVDGVFMEGGEIPDPGDLAQKIDRSGFGRQREIQTGPQSLFVKWERKSCGRSSLHAMREW